VVDRTLKSNYCYYYFADLFVNRFKPLPVLVLWPLWMSRSQLRPPLLGQRRPLSSRHCRFPPKSPREPLKSW